MADASIVAKYGNTYDILSHKWVKDMTEAELIARGYKTKAPAKEPEATKGTKARAKTTSAN